ncbi:hypothetical protein D9615_000019 [Tricholomella constricta]|uniref:Uncharacterized protein n=1 Tax=Tricholomella constricta TaxID=117010 RepID=A0A8H5HRY8_9AGAR|nr:hypothetical protein D9615_000019 [Tricholomella constricta]
MSLSIDDLASSLSASHIGQEALDLAALQAQLAQTLFGQSITHSSNPQKVSRKTSFTQPCNTPTSSYSFSHFHDVRQGKASGSESIWAFDGSSFNLTDNTEEDERMVEDLLIPCSPMSMNPLQFSLPFSAGSKSHHLSNNQTSETHSSLFTSTDPFYIAQSQAQYQNPAPHSAFTQLGQLSHQSPFCSAQGRDHPGTSNTAPPLSMDTHPFIIATSTAFDH